MVNKYIAELSLEGVLPPEFRVSEKSNRQSITNSTTRFENLTTALLIVADSIEYLRKIADGS